MKTMKKLGALLLALVLCMSLCVPAFAASSDNTNFSITISNATIGQEYTAYKIFDATYDDNGNTSYSIKSTDDWFNDIVGNVEANDGVYTTSVFTLTPTSSVDDVITYTVTVNTGVTDNDIIAYMTEVIDQYASYDADGNFTGWNIPTGFTSAAAGNAGKSPYTLDVSESGAGYYFVTTNSGSIVSITTTDPNAYILDKNGGITLKKQIKEGLDVDEESMHGDVEAMGDDVEFEVTADVPLYAPGDANSPEGYLVTDYEFVDTMSAGLEIRGLVEGVDYTVENGHYYATEKLINEWIVVYDGTVDANGDPITYNLKDIAFDVVLELTDMTIYTYVDENGDEKIGIQFDGFKLSYNTIALDVYDTVVPKDEDGTALGYDTAYELVAALQEANGCNYPANASIVIDYTAHVTEEAVYDNTNEINMDYNMTPYRNPNPRQPEYGGSRRDDDDVYVLVLTILKVDGSDDIAPLAGAEFQLKGTNLNDVVTNTSETYTDIDSYAGYQEEKEEGTELWFELIGGSYTNVNPYELSNTEDADALAKYVVNPFYGDSDYPDAADYPYVAYIREITYSSGLQSAVDRTVTGTTDENGVLSFNGLTEGTWTLTEIKAPDGYNLLSEDYTITISVEGWSADSETGKIVPKWNVSADSSDVFSLDASTGIISITVENNTGTELPGTGGMGTTIFYIIGAILVCGAAVVLITRRRMRSEA